MSSIAFATYRECCGVWGARPPSRSLQKPRLPRPSSPAAPSHIIIIPKVKDGLDRLASAEQRHIQTLGHLMWAAKHVASLEGLGEGFRVVVNDGPAGCQSVYHLHLHVIGGKQLTWPPGTGAPEGSMSG